MRENKFFKILCSLPIVLISLYFIPFIGICLIIFRYYVYRNRYKKYYSMPTYLLICGLLIVLSRLMYYIFDITKFDYSNISVLNTLLDSPIYLKILDYGKFLIIVSIIFFILSYLFRNLTRKLSSSLYGLVNKRMEKSAQIERENNLLVKERREQARNTHVVKCPNCGADNTLNEKTGVCKYCRRQLENKEMN